MNAYHIPALLQESIEGLKIKPDGCYVDVTFGGGGHSREILKHLTKGKIIGFDQDQDAIQNTIDDPRFIFCHGNFRFLKNYLRYYGIKTIDGLIGDLGVSSHHFDTVERGFTFQGDSPLDMRMNPLSKLTAYEIINHYPKEQLQSIFKKFGEVDNAQRLASQIVSSRSQKELVSSSQFIDAIKVCIPRGLGNKYMAKVYQALRIEVNQELESLEDMLVQCREVMNPNARIVIITYHSLEDRIVKNYFKTGNFEGKVDKDFYGNVSTPFKIINNKVIVASEDETASNSRARSAKLRIAEKII
jgi:16S rRNA (cytosine1402-N4)-methyltransferase